MLLTTVVGTDKFAQIGSISCLNRDSNLPTGLGTITHEKNSRVRDHNPHDIVFYYAFSNC